MLNGLIGLVVLVLYVFGTYNVITSPVDTPKKLGWIVLIWLIPVVGFIIWAILGPRGKKLF
jgi:hypothetical protein